MFSTLTAGSTLYIFTKGEEPKLEIGTVETVSKPRPNFQSTYTGLSQPLDMVIDSIGVRVGGELLKFDSIPTNSSVHTYNGGSVVISDSRDAMTQEFDNSQRTSRSVLDSVPYHEKMVDACKRFKKQLNPEIVEQEKRDKRIDSLEKSIKDLTSLLTVMLKSKDNQ